MMHNLLQVLCLKFEQRFSFRMVARYMITGTATVHYIMRCFNNFGLTWSLSENFPPKTMKKSYVKNT